MSDFLNTLIFNKTEQRKQIQLNQKREWEIINKIIIKNNKAKEK